MFWTALEMITISVACLTNKIKDCLYSRTVQTYCAYYGWYVLEFCSKVEIKVQHAYAWIRPYLPSRAKDEISLVTFIKDGKEMHKYSFNEFISLRESGHFDTEPYDFILYELPIHNNHKYDKYTIHHTHHKNIIKIEYNAANEYTFNSIQFKFDNIEELYNINFYKNQFMVNGNILFDKDFMKWVMLKYYNVIVQDDDKYSISFIDQNMNYIVLTDVDHIILKNKTYEIASTERPLVTLIEKKEQ